MREEPRIQALIDRAATIGAGVHACQTAVQAYRAARCAGGAPAVSADARAMMLWMELGMRLVSDRFVEALDELGGAVPGPRFAEYLTKVNDRRDELLKAAPGAGR